MLISTTSLTKWHSKNKDWYISKGYMFTRIGDQLVVEVKDLHDGSSAIVNVKCDCCGKEIIIRWSRYIQSKKENNYYCNPCSNRKNKQWTSFYDWCSINISKKEADEILSRWDYDKNIDREGNELSPKDVSYNSGLYGKGYWFKCLDHPEHESELKNINSFTINHKKSIVCNQCNTIGFHFPHFSRYLVNKEDINNHSIQSSKYVLMKCPDCGYERERAINTLVNRGFSCPRCSDGVPYPEKFLFNVLEQLIDKDFQTQLSKITYKWCNSCRYDFYLNRNNTIIETHGIQHYEETKNDRWGTLEKIQENDFNKEQLAKNNGIESYIVIDCRYSNTKWIKNSVMNSALPKLLNFKESDIDWLKCDEFACSSFVQKACHLWNNGIKDLDEIAKELKRHKQTINNYLKQGVKFGWCDYTKEKSSNYLNNKKIKRVICLTTGEVFDSITKASKKLHVSTQNISICCAGKSKYAGKEEGTNKKLVWMYYDKYLKSDKRSIINLLESIINNNKNVKLGINKSNKVGKEDKIIKITKKKTKITNKRKVKCLTTGEIFETIAEASRKYHLDRSSISACCRGKRKSIGKDPKTNEKLIWIYI